MEGAREKLGRGEVEGREGREGPGRTAKEERDKETDADNEKTRHGDSVEESKRRKKGQRVGKRER